ncbi:MAG: family 10 glycosylhydrolase [Muribaculaceae bacterium]|nr:family 10 glycosylhydrolase [Muribaculaceae bacterium]
MNRLLFFTMVALTALLCMPHIQAQEAQKREMRTVWVATVSNIDWPQTRGSSTSVVNQQKKQLTDLLDGFVKANMNAICLQVRPMADALYRSSYEPWSSFLTGTRGKDPGWDPMEFAVQECHKRGLEFHAWVNPYRFSNSGGTDCTTAIDQEIKASGMLMTVGNRIVFNPALQASRDRLLNVCREMIENYDIDGIIFDDYFYPGDGTPTDSSAPDYQLWQNSGSGMSIADWRRANVNEMVKQMYDMVQLTRPGVKFGIGPAGVAGTRATSASKHGVDPCPTGSDWQYNQIYSDPLAWLEEGTIDYISPQLYWKCNHSTNPFGPLTQWWSYVANHFGRHHYASHNIYFMAGSNTQEDWDEIIQQIRYSRQYNLDNAPGVNFYSAKYIDGPTCSGLANYLAQQIFTRPALTPAMTWKNRKVYSAPADAAMNGTALTWTAVNERAQIKYAIYAIPNNEPLEAITSTQFEGIKSDYLIGVTYDSTFTLPTAYRDGYWYAVTVIDGWGNENTPAYINAPAGEADQVTLRSPLGITLTKWQQTFSWTAATDATYTLQIAGDEAFSDILISRPKVTTTSLLVNLSALKSSTTYYWRIITSQNGRFDKASEVATFTTAGRPFAPAATLLAPTDGAAIDADFTLQYSVDATVTSSTVQVASDAQFTSVKLESADATASGGVYSLALQPGLLGKGTFYWRVITTAADCDPGTSAARSFSITGMPTGAFEPGYVIKRDINTYETLEGGLSLTNRWVRSVKEEYDNITFDGGGLMNRGFTVSGDHVLVVGRVDGASDADVYITHYDAATGERIKSVTVDEAVKGLYYPGNDIFLDQAGHVLISNLVLNAASQPVKIFQVNPDTGEATLRASLTVSGTATTRIDHCNVLGDVTASRFYVFAAMSNGTQLVRWTVQNGAVTETKVASVSARYPQAAGNFGLAPRIYPVSETLAYVTGGSTHLTLYNFSTGNIADSFSYNTAIQPEGTEANGAAFFTLKDVNYMLYPYSDFRSGTGFRFALAANADDTDYAGYDLQWIFPQQGLGSVNSQTWDAPCAVTDGSLPNEKNIYIYVPGNGLAAYTLTAGVLGDVNHDGKVDVSDVNAVINVILGISTDANLRADSDLDGDGKVDVSDVNRLINIILHT